MFYLRLLFLFYFFIGHFVLMLKHVYVELVFIQIYNVWATLTMITIFYFLRQKEKPI